MHLFNFNSFFPRKTGPSSEQRSGSNSRGNPFGRGANPPSTNSNKPDSSKPNKPRDPDEEVDSDSDDIFKCPRGDGLYADPLSCKKVLSKNFNFKAKINFQIVLLWVKISFTFVVHGKLIINPVLQACISMINSNFVHLNHLN